MNLQETLYNLFGVRVERSNFLTNWYQADLKDFSDEELSTLYKTCRDLADTAKLKALAATVRTRIVTEKIKRYNESVRPKINLQKNKGKKRATKRTKKSKG